MASPTKMTAMANSTTVQKEWLLVDAEDQILGRLASKLAILIRGKHKPYFTPHVDCGDHVIVINAEKIRLTGKKMATKEYQRYSGYPGGQSSEVAEDLIKRKPLAMVEAAVKGMIPKNRLGSAVFHNLHAIEGTEHKFGAQKPRTIKLSDIK